MVLEGLLHLRELVFSDRAQRTFKIIRQFLKRCAWFDTCFRYAYFRVILPSANVANILFHNRSCFFMGW